MDPWKEPFQWVYSSPSKKGNTLLRSQLGPVSEEAAHRAFWKAYSWSSSQGSTTTWRQLPSNSRPQSSAPLRASFGRFLAGFFFEGSFQDSVVKGFLSGFCCGFHEAYHRTPCLKRSGGWLRGSLKSSLRVSIELEAWNKTGMYAGSICRQTSKHNSRKSHACRHALVGTSACIHWHMMTYVCMYVRLSK